MNNHAMRPAPYDAVILDLDGVITQTAHLHAQAWKRMFDDYLKRRAEQDGEDHSAFDIESNYRAYVDGKPRYEGARSFLQARGIDLPEGDPDDPSGRETVCGLGNRKNEIFHELLRSEGVETYDDAVEQIHTWRRQGVKTAMVTSSRNGAAILEAAGLHDLFDAQVDGVEAERLGLAGKPAPDLFIEAARRIGCDPQQAIVVEDAIAGVEAGRAGAFGLVVGVARDGDAGALRAHGADIVVRDLGAIDDADQRHQDRPNAQPPSAMVHFDEIEQELGRHRWLALFTDYDGTLTPIVERPENATLSEHMRSLLQKLAGRATVAVISGRDLADVRAKVQRDDLYYAGSHGFDIAGPDDLYMQQKAAEASLPELDSAEVALRGRLASLRGGQVERKRFALAVHYRQTAEEDVPRLERIVDDVQAAHEGLRKRGGKKIFELQPDIDWDKGRAVCWLLDRLDLDRPDVLPMYLGDDTTDEDAFLALRGRGLTIRVGGPDQPTHAEYVLQDAHEVERFFETLLDHLDT